MQRAALESSKDFQKILSWKQIKILVDFYMLIKDKK